jgi:hypothetical protein
MKIRKKKLMKEDYLEMARELKKLNKEWEAADYDQES